MDDTQDRDDFETAFHYFVDALKILESDAETQCEVMGDYNVPWEIQHDVSGGGLSLARVPLSPLTQEQTARIIELAGRLKELPTEAIAPAGLPTTNHAGSMKAMSHDAWRPLRQEAADLLKLLEGAIRKNQSYFGGE